MTDAIHTAVCAPMPLALNSTMRWAESPAAMNEAMESAIASSTKLVRPAGTIVSAMVLPSTAE